MAVTILKKKNTSIKVLGIDPSTKLGWVATKYEDSAISLVARGVLKFPKTKGFQRLVDVSDELGALLVKTQPDLIVIEGYSYGSINNGMIQTEIGAITRLEAARHCESIIEVAPASLKKYVTGVGNCKKDLIMKEVYKRWGFEGTDDECDAYAMSLFGHAILGHPIDMPKANMAAVVNWLKNNEGNHYLPKGY